MTIFQTENPDRVAGLVKICKEGSDFCKTGLCCTWIHTMSGTYVRQDRNEVEDLHGENNNQERTTSAQTAMLDMQSDNYFSFLPKNNAGYGGFFPNFQSGYSPYKNHQEEDTEINVRKYFKRNTLHYSEKLNLFPLFLFV